MGVSPHVQFLNLKHTNLETGKHKSRNGNVQPPIQKKTTHSLEQIPWIENEHLPSIHKTFHGAADIHK